MAISDGGDSVLRELLQLIARFGWAVRHVGSGADPGEAAFSYTVGLTAMNHPEVVVTGLPFDAAQSFLNLVGAEVRQGRRFVPGTPTTEFTSSNSPIVFIRADDTSGLTAVRQVYGLVEAVQMIWPDSAGRLPWTAGYNNPPEAQPLLGQQPSQ